MENPNNTPLLDLISKYIPPGNHQGRFLNHSLYIQAGASF